MEINLAVNSTTEAHLLEYGSSGYLWDIDSANKSGFILVTRETQLKESNSGKNDDQVIGGSNLVNLKIKGLKKGQARIYHKRPWVNSIDDSDKFLIINVT